MAEEKHQVWTEYDVRVPMRDGVELSADIYRPMESKGGERFPAILARTPYNKALAQQKTRDDFKSFAEHGYAVVWMDVRGRGDSDGVFTPYRNDGRDGYDAIEWIAAQSWCDGKVGTLGGSYLGRIQWLAALDQPPHLVTMIALVTPSDPFVESPTGTQGPMHICWVHMTSGRVMQNAEVVDWMKVYEHLPLMTMDEAAGRVCQGWRGTLQPTRLDGFWERHLKPWDAAAGVALVRAAGGRVTDFRGGDDWLFGRHLVATNGLIHEALRGSLAPLRGL